MIDPNLRIVFIPRGGHVDVGQVYCFNHAVIRVVSVMQAGWSMDSINKHEPLVAKLTDATFECADCLQVLSKSKPSPSQQEEE